MRGAPLAAALLLALAGCSLGTEGAPCRNTDNCAEGLACGASGTCTRAAAACGDEGARPLCKAGTQQCRGGRGGVPEECRADDRGEECASFQPKDTCSAHEVCGEAGGVAACGCDQTLPCWATQQPYCEGTPGERVVCAQDADGCWFEESRAGCGSVRTCQPGASGATCACPDTRCTPADRAFCDPGGGIVTCLDVDGCSIEQSPAPCGPSQACTGPAGSAACTCVDDDGCGPGVPSLCDGQGKVIACITEPGNGCRHPAAQAVACPTVHQTCGAAAGQPGQCQCVADRCAADTVSLCDGTTTLVTCQTDAASCPFEALRTDCAPGKACRATSTTTSDCLCPGLDTTLGSGCQTLGTRICAGGDVLVCAIHSAGSECKVWAFDETCAAPMSCSGGACVCPAVTDGVYYADRTLGTAFPAPPGGPTPTGAENPPRCRFASIEEALARANAVPQGGGEVRATGASPLAPMIFVATGALSIGPGVTVTTTDSPLGTASYTLQAPAGLGTGAFVTLGAGASLSGFHIQSGGSTGPALTTGCATGVADPVLVDTVRISGAGSFSAGLSHGSADCPVTLRNAEVSGVGRGVDLPAGSLAVEGGAFSGNVTHVHAQPGTGASVDLTVGGATMTGATDSAMKFLALGSGSRVALVGNFVRGNGFTTTFTLAGGPRGGGGLVFTGPFAATVTFGGNELRSNSGDQILVAASGGSLDLRGDPACVSIALINRLGCYDGSVGRGIFSNGATVQVGGNSWVFQPAELGSDVGGTGIVGFDTNACAPANLPCP